MNQIAENGNKIKSIIKPIILCGYQNIYVGGHCDDSRWTIAKSDKLKK